MTQQAGRRADRQEVPGRHRRETELTSGPGGQDTLGGTDQETVGGDLVGPSAHEEATLVGAQTRIGDALVSIHGHAGAFGVYGEVLEPGAVKLGDSVYVEAFA